ncbi:MAG: helix-turn-helix transcriptional regulator [Caldicoprobacterales bacterium]
MGKNRFNGKILRNKRMELGLSQLELAEMVNNKYGTHIVDVTTISRWEINPKAAPRYNKLFKVATVLGCNIEDFYGNNLKEETLEGLFNKLTKDKKEEYISRIKDAKEQDEPLTLLMKSWKSSFMRNTDVTEYEKIENNNEIYEMLGWDNKNYDVICSAWNTYLALLVTYAQYYNIKFTDCDEKIDKVMYYYSKNKHLGYWYKNNEGKVLEATFFKHNGKYPYSSYYNKFLDDENIHSIFAKRVAKEITDIMVLSKLCHCVANFMPCPNIEGEKYNRIKGQLSDVRDYFPLMIDKIQKCVSQQSELEDVEDRVLQNWHSFFVENRRRYFLEDFYYVTKKDEKYILVGIPLFKGQSLENPMPNNLEEAKECLENIIKNIQNRALRMAYFLKYTRG